VPRLSVLILTAASLLFPTVLQAQSGPPAGMIYAHDVLFRTVGTPTDLPDRGEFDTIYVFGGNLASVSESAPGDPDYNGGRWEVRMVTFISIAPTQFTNAEDLLAAAESGDVTISDVVRRFECPLIHVPKKNQ
jgi:hypothetical protein